MRLQLLLTLICFSSCSQQDDFASAFAKCKVQNPLSSLSDVDEMILVQEATYECIRGANGPVISATSIDSQPIRTTSSAREAVLIYYWSIPESGAPAYYRKNLYSEIKALNLLSYTYKGNVKFVGFSPNDAASIRLFTNRNPLNFPQVAEAYPLWVPLLDKPSGGLPLNGHFLMFIDREGHVTSMSSGMYSNTAASVRIYTSILEACLTNSAYND